MKLKELLNKIEKGEETPKKFKYDNQIFIYNSETNDYIYENGNISFFTDYIANIYHMEDVLEFLNYEVEIIEEDDFEDIKSFDIHYSWDYIDYKNIEELKKYVNKDFQNIFDTLDKLINNQKKIIQILKNKE